MTWRSVVQPYLVRGERIGEQLADMIRSRSRREQILLLVLAAFMGFGLCMQSIWRPLASHRDAVEQDLERYRTLLTRLGGEDGAAPPPPMAASIRETPSDRALRLGLTVSRIEPDDRSTRLVLDDADFAQLMTWIAELESEGGARVQSLRLQRAVLPGRVSAELTLDTPP